MYDSDKTPADYLEWVTYTQHDGSSFNDVVFIKPKNPHVMYMGNLNVDWAEFEKEASKFHYIAPDLVHPATYKTKHLIFSGKGKFAEARLKRADELKLEDDDTVEGILLNVIYDCDWCDMSNESIQSTIRYLSENYIIQRKEK